MAQINWLASLAVEIEWLGYLFWIEENRVWTNKSIEKCEMRYRLLLNKLVPWRDVFCLGVILEIKPPNHGLWKPRQLDSWFAGKYDELALNLINSNTVGLRDGDILKKGKITSNAVDQPALETERLKAFSLGRGKTWKVSMKSTNNFTLCQFRLRRYLSTSNIKNELIVTYKHGCGHLAIQSSPVLVNFLSISLMHLSGW